MGLEIINELKKEQGLTNAQIAAMSGVTQSTLDKITSGANTNPKLDTLQAICRVLGCTLNDFMDCSGPVKEASSGLSEEAQRIAKDYDRLSEHGKGAVRAVLRYESEASLSTLEERPSPHKAAARTVCRPRAAHRRGGTVELPVYDQPAAAGLGNYLDEPDRHMERCPAAAVPPEADFGVIISGDSMEPKIHDGAIVFVQACLSIDPGQIGIFVLNGQSYCKKLVVDHAARQIRLVSLHPGYPDIVVGGYDSFRTVGRVLGQWLRGC